MEDINTKPLPQENSNNALPKEDSAEEINMAEMEKDVQEEDDEAINMV